MGLYFIIHKTDIDEFSKIPGQILEDLIDHGIDKLGRIHFSGVMINLGLDITIDFRCGDNPDKFAGVRPDFWYSDNDVIAEMLELGADKCGGQRLKDISRVVPIITEYLVCYKEY